MRVSFYLCLAVTAAASLAHAVGIYAGGGLAAYGGLAYHADFLGIPIVVEEDLGSSFWVGGGVAVPVWRYAGVVTPSLELATDVGFSMKSEISETDDWNGAEISFKVVAPRELLVFALGVGPGGAIRPFVGFGGGVAVVPWAVQEPTTGMELDSNTEVKVALDIPFGCEFYLAPKFALAMRADYFIITGDADPSINNEVIETSMPNAFLFNGGFRADF